MTTLLNDNKFPQQPPRLPTDVLIARAIEEIKNTSGDTFNDLVRAQRRGIDLVWHNPDLTPQQIIDGLGSDALKVFQFHGGLTDYIKSVANLDGVVVDLKYPTNAFTVDSNGAITVTNDPYIIP